MLVEFDPRIGIKYIRDPIYSYIPVTSRNRRVYPDEVSTELDIIDSPWVQRLRRIRQTQETYCVYPGAEHSRFQHVIGVMYLAGRFAHQIYGGFLERIPEGQKSLLPSVNLVEELFRLAGLLHDVGHGPFSHTLDSSYKNYFGHDGVNHEIISQWIIKEQLGDSISGIRRSPHGNFATDEEIYPEEIAWLIHPPRLGDPPLVADGRVSKLPKFLTMLYSADTLDYLVRDSYHCGTGEYGAVDIERLINTTFMWPGDARAPQSNIVLRKSSVPALRNFIISRIQMYEAVYFHKAARAMMLELLDLLPEVLSNLNFPRISNTELDDEQVHGQFLEEFYSFDDFSLMTYANYWSSHSENDSQRELGNRLKSVFHLRELKWHQAFERSPDLDLLLRKGDLTSYPLQLGAADARQVIKTENEILERKLREGLSYLQGLPRQQLSDVGFSSEEVELLERIVPAEVDLRVDSPAIDIRDENPWVNDASKYVYLYDPQLSPDQPDVYGFRRATQDLPIKYVHQRVYSEKEYANLLAKVWDILVKQNIASASPVQDTHM